MPVEYFLCSSWLSERHDALLIPYSDRGSGGVYVRGLAPGEFVLAGFGSERARSAFVDEARDRVYVGYPGTVSLSSLTMRGRMAEVTLSDSRHWPVPFSPTQYYSVGGTCSMVADLRARRLYIADAGLATLGVIDLDTEQFLWATQLDSPPWGIALDPSRGLLAVALRDQGAVAIYRTGSP
jgi:hypothetical protein